MQDYSNHEKVLEDIRPALKERLRRAVAARDDHAAKAAEFSAEVDDLTRQIDREEARFSSKGVPAHRDLGEPLTTFILKELLTGPMNKDTLRDRAERRGYDIDGRSIHVALVNLVRQDKVTERPQGRFELSVQPISHG